MMEQVCRIEQLLRLEKTLDITHEATADMISFDLSKVKAPRRLKKRLSKSGGWLSKLLSKRGFDFDHDPVVLRTGVARGVVDDHKRLSFCTNSYTMLCANNFGVKPNQVTQEMRAWMKGITFNYMYGSAPAKGQLGRLLRFDKQDVAIYADVHMKTMLDSIENERREIETFIANGGYTIFLKGATSECR